MQQTDDEWERMKVDYRLYVGVRLVGACVFAGALLAIAYWMRS